MKYIQGVPRRQTILFPKAIDDYIPARRQAHPAVGQGQTGLPVGRQVSKNQSRILGIDNILIFVEI